MAITSQIKTVPALGKGFVTEWQKAGLLKASVIKPVFTTIDQRLVLRRLGQLEQVDLSTLKQLLELILG